MIKKIILSLGLFFLRFSSLKADALFQDILTREVGIKTLVFHDTERQRILITEVYFPNHTGSGVKSTKDLFNRTLEAKEVPFLEGKNKLPLILFSHGYKGDRFTLSWLQTVLASYGYITASVDHFSGTWYLQDPEQALMRWQRPLDIQFVLSSLLSDPIFGPHIDSEKIGFVGYSLGGLTGIWLAGGIADLYRKPTLENGKSNELEEGTTEDILSNIDFNAAKKSYRDPRIKAAVLFAPSYGFAFDKEGLAPIKIPILIIAGEKDADNDLRENSLYFAKWTPNAKLDLISGTTTSQFVLQKGTHLQANQKETIKTILRFFSENLSEEKQKALIEKNNYNEMD